MGALAAPTWIAPLRHAFAPRRRWFVAMSRLRARTAPKAQPAPAATLAPPLGPGDAQRFGATMVPHLDAAYTLARFLTRGDAAAEDIVHDAYLRALRAYPSFHGGNSKAWILAIVRNCFMTWAKGRTTARIVADEDAVAAAQDEHTPEQDLARRQTSERMRRLIEALPPEQAEVIVLREIEELSYRDIAAAIDAPIGTVMSRLARAREQLAKAWRESGDAP